MREIASRLIALYYRLRTMGRVRGPSYLMSWTSLIRVSSGARITIGVNATIGPQARLVAQAEISIGADAFIGKNSTVVAFAPVSIAERVLIGENCSIHTENHGRPGQRLVFESAPITIERDVWIGAGVVVTAGVTIGEGATIGANAVVTRDIPPKCLAVGVPARVVRNYDDGSS